MERHALLFRVKPGSESAVAEILASYESPSTHIDDTSRLIGTTVFMHGDMVVRVMEIEGDLGSVAAHLSGQPAIQAVEARLNDHLAQPRDMSDPQSARASFGRARMSRVAEQRPGSVADNQLRAALVRRLEPGTESATDALYEHAGVNAGRPGEPLAGHVTVFRHDDIVVTIYGGEQRPELLDGEHPMSLVTDRRAGVS
jgi:hypothetical protein